MRIFLYEHIFIIDGKLYMRICFVRPGDCLRYELYIEIVVCIEHFLNNLEAIKTFRSNLIHNILQLPNLETI